MAAPGDPAGRKCTRRSLPAAPSRPRRSLLGAPSMFSEAPKIPSKNTSIFECILAPFWFPKLFNFGVIFQSTSDQLFHSFFYRYLFPSRSPFGINFSQCFGKFWDHFRLMISPIFECNFKSILIVFRIPPNLHFAALA